MTPEAMDEALPTDPFSAWLARARKAQRSGGGMDVPCGECRGCCTSSYFIHIAPDETAALARIPKALLFPAPGLPKGHRLLGYDEKGHCPMFKDNACSIYAHRPRTCRDYDCRVFPAAGLEAGEDKPVIARQAARWKFALESEEDRSRLRAVQAAAAFLRKHASAFPKDFLPAHPTQQAVLALKIYRVFLSAPEDASPENVRRTTEAVLEAFRDFPASDDT